MAFENIRFYSTEVSDDYILKTREERTEFTDGRSTPFEEELEALRNSYDQLPDHFPEPYFSIEDEQGLAAVGMERLNFETRLEYATMDGYTSEEAMNIYDQALDIVEELHSNPDLNPHGDLIGNVLIVDDSPVLIDPKGIPESTEEEQEWVMDDWWQMSWIKDGLKKSL